jgi:hypothetical protein
VTRKPHRTLALEEKDYDPGFEAGDDLSHTALFSPEPVTPRKPPAPLARFLVCIGGEAFASGLSCPFTCPLVGGGAFAPFGWSAGALGGSAAFETFVSSDGSVALAILLAPFKPLIAATSAHSLVGRICERA